MPLRKNVLRGINFLLSNQNKDGGIPCIKPGDISGCWTTAEALETFTISPFFPKSELIKLEQMVNFLLKYQLSNGGWPLVVGGQDVSIMSTGHSISALTYAREIFMNSPNISNRIHNSIKEAMDCLNTSQNEDGGWGVEVKSMSGKSNRIISTTYALRGYFAQNLTTRNSFNVNKAINFFVDIQNEDGGWGTKGGNPSDPDNTARVVTALIRSERFNPKDKIIQRSINFILKYKNNLRIDIESYVKKGAPGETIYHSNTLYDVLETLLRCDSYYKEIEKLLQWFLKHQEDDGCWYLSDNNQVVKSISIWSTSEAINVIDLAQERYLGKLYSHNGDQKTKRSKTFLTVSSFLNIALIFYIFNLHIYLIDWWSNLSLSWQQSILVGIFGAIIIGIISSFINPVINKWFFNVFSRIKRISKK